MANGQKMWYNYKVLEAKMKKFLLWILLVLAVLALFVGGVLGYAYLSVDETKLPDISVSLGASELTLNGYEWSRPVFSGAMYKHVIADASLAADKLPPAEDAQPKLTVPEAYTVKISISSQDKEIFAGDENSYAEFSLPQNGEFLYKIDVIKPQSEHEEYGSFHYRAQYSLAAEPKITLSADTIDQGGVIAVVVSNIMNGTKPEIYTDLGMASFTEINNQMLAFVPVAYNREVGEYKIDIKCGDLEKNAVVKVRAHDFTRQDMTIDEGIANETANSAEANAEYRAKIYPLFETADSVSYWSGLFKQPVYGEITTEYGLRRYINGSKTPERHGGMDIAVPEGTPVPAPNAGRVVFAQFIKLTGNTVVIEHGAGLKSYFFHMSKLSVDEGQMVEQGDIVGEVGTTGFSTGPHLHYEVKIGNQSINPVDMFNGTSGIYFAG